MLAPDVQASDSSLIKLPISSIVRAVCEAASGGPELLYEVMIKMSLMVEATAPTYGLSIWAAPSRHKPSLRWAEGLEETEIALGEPAVAEILAKQRTACPLRMKVIRRSALVGDPFTGAGGRGAIWQMCSTIDN